MKHSEENKADLAILALVAICITLLFFMSACRTTEGVTTTREVRIVERDTCIITRADSATATALLHCDSAYNIVVDALTIAEGKNLCLEARLSKINTNTLPRAEMAVKAVKTTDTIYIPIRETYEAESVASTEIVYRNTKFAKFCIGFFWFVLSAIISSIITILVRYYLQIRKI